MDTDVKFHLPTKPYSVVDAINRVAAAQGSCNYAMRCSGADYNGHFVHLSWNSYRGYYIAEYFWGGREVITRNEDACAAVLAAVRHYQSQGLGGKLAVSVKAEDAEAVRALGVLIEGEEPKDYGPWYTWRHKLVGSAYSWEYKHGLGPATFALLAARDEEDYNFLISHKGHAELQTRKPLPEALARPI